MIYYELWDLKGRNVVGTYASEAEALSLVREAIDQHGRRYVDDLTLGWSDDQDEERGGEIATGAVLADRALAQSVA